MKRADLTVGAEYLATTDPDWASATSYDHRRVVVLDATTKWTSRWNHRPAKPLVLPDGTTFESYRANPDPTGSAANVVVRSFSPTDGPDAKGRVELMPVARIRAPWAEAWAQVLADRAARDKAEAERRAAANANAMRYDALELELIARGFSTQGVRRRDADVVLPMDLLEAILTQVRP